MSSSGTSWGAVIGGAFIAAALSLILICLGAGFGLEAISPWSHSATPSNPIGILALIWLVVTQAIAFAMGGYLTGRLRTKWHVIHNEEVHFRDTANGFLSWAVAVVVATAFFGAAAASMSGGAAGVSALTAGTEQVLNPERIAYLVDRLFRTDRPGPPENDAAARAEAAGILANILDRNEEASSDSGYLAQLVAARTGLSANAAAKRVSDTLADARRDVRQYAQGGRSIIVMDISCAPHRSVLRKLCRYGRRQTARSRATHCLKGDKYAICFALFLRRADPADYSDCVVHSPLLTHRVGWKYLQARNHRSPGRKNWISVA